MEKVQAELIDGKPHFGLWFGNHLVINAEMSEPYEQDECYKNAIDLLSPKPPEGVEIRNETTIFRPPWGKSPLQINATVAKKHVLWGRAFRVMKLLKKGIKRYKKVYRGGKRRLVRCDRR